MVKNDQTMAWIDFHQPQSKWLGVFLISYMFLGGCSYPSFTEERYKSLVSTDDVGRPQVESVLGPGDAVQNEYTDEQIALHELPANTKFKRWQHPDDPTTYSFIGFSEDTAVHFATLHTQ